MQPEELSNTLKRSVRGSRKRRKKNVQSQHYEGNLFWATGSFLTGSSLLFWVNVKCFNEQTEPLMPRWMILLDRGWFFPPSTSVRFPMRTSKLFLLRSNLVWLLQEVSQIILVPYFGKRGRANQRAMRPSDSQLRTTTAGLNYFVLNEFKGNEKSSWWYQWPWRWNALMIVSPGNPVLLWLASSSWQKESHDVMAWSKN